MSLANKSCTRLDFPQSSSGTLESDHPKDPIIIKICFLVTDMNIELRYTT